MAKLLMFLKLINKFKQRHEENKKQTKTNKKVFTIDNNQKPGIQII